ncbi:hypothetical protein [Streptomyces sp. NPDC048002]|uniref:hypothetical protein n=1 Tax=Streptomyces sp. NPDC048002 TaxID=3154344 RepID=UPI0033D76F3C
MVIAWCCAIFIFGEDTAGMLRASIATMERAFTGLNACDCVFDEAGAHGEVAGERLRQPLAQEAGEEVAAELADLESIADEVQQSVASPRLLNRIVGREAAVEVDSSPADVSRPRETDLRISGHRRTADGEDRLRGRVVCRGFSCRRHGRLLFNG